MQQLPLPFCLPVSFCCLLSVFDLMAKKITLKEPIRFFLGLPGSGVTNETSTGDGSRNGEEIKLQTEEERA